MSTLADADLAGLADDAEPTDAERASVSSLAELQIEQEAEVIQLTALLQAALERLRKTSQVDLPDAMRAIRQSEFRLLDGRRVKLEEKLTGLKLTNPEGLAWVEANGGASTIKTSITVEMDRGDLESARELMQELRGHRLANRFKTLSMEESVNASTNGAFAREKERDGANPPLELLGVYRMVRTVVGDRAPKPVELKGLAAPGLTSRRSEPEPF